MTEIIAYLKAHADELALIVTSIVTAASAISNLTPTDADNKIVAMLKKVVDFLALNFKK